MANRQDPQYIAWANRQAQAFEPIGLRTDAEDWYSAIGEEWGYQSPLLADFVSFMDYALRLLRMPELERRSNLLRVHEQAIMRDVIPIELPRGQYQFL